MPSKKLQNWTGLACQCQTCQFDELTNRIYLVSQKENVIGFVIKVLTIAIV